ncbi:MAG: sugar ABC transporter permease [Eubacteriales bacterium]|nr:sugar ABC transporter permease [Eubacteriales bacterium]
MIQALKRYKWPYLFIMPFFLLFLIFQLIPNIFTVVISLTKWNAIAKPQYVGLKNYQLLFCDQMFWDATWNTFIYWLISGIIIIVLALFIGSLLTSKQLKIKKIYSTITFLPNVCAVISMAIIFKLFFDTNEGLFNSILVSVGIPKQEWITGASLSKIPVIFLYSWRNIPWYTMIIVSGLLNISPDFYEAAHVDGANTVQQFFKITLPSLSNVLFFCFITLTSDAWKIFNESYMLKGPSTSNISLFQYMYDSGFTIFKMGYASAIGVVLTVILLVVSIVQFIIRKRQGEV